MTDYTPDSDELDNTAPRPEGAADTQDGTQAPTQASDDAPQSSDDARRAPDGENGTSTEQEISLADIEAELDAEFPDPDGEEISALREDYEALNDRHLRLAAEFNNYRRRTDAERLDLWTRAQADFVEGFLDVLDDLQRVAGLDLSNATVETIMEGIDLVEREFMRMLSDAGVEALDPTGEPFDPEQMEAMMRVPVESEEEDNRVAQVFQKGYALKGRLVRPARVSVHTSG